MSYEQNFRVWRGDAEGGDFRDYDVEVNEGEVVLDVIHRLQATQTRFVGTARQASAVPAVQRSTVVRGCSA